MPVIRLFAGEARDFVCLGCKTLIPKPYTLNPETLMHGNVSGLAVLSFSVLRVQARRKKPKTTKTNNYRPGNLQF